MPRPLLQILLALTVLAAGWHLWTTRTNKAPEMAADEQTDAPPGTFIEAVQTWSFDDAGNLDQMLEAQRIERFDRGNYSLVDEPRLYAHGDGGETWSIRAERGRLQHASNELLLRKNVVLSHDQSGTRARTHMLDVQLDARTASGERPVTIVQGPNRTTADGLFVNLEQETVLLKPNVKTLYAPDAADGS